MNHDRLFSGSSRGTLDLKTVSLAVLVRGVQQTLLGMLNTIVLSATTCLCRRLVHCTYVS